MRGVGRFDKRGSISDALKQGALTYGGGLGARYLSGAKGLSGGPSTYSMEGFRQGPIGRMFQSGSPLDKTPMGDPGAGGIGGQAAKWGPTDPSILDKLKELPSMVKQQLLVGGVVAGASALYDFFTGDFRPQEAGETMEEYLAARKARVGEQMRTYMDSYYKFNPEYSALDDAGKDAFVAQYNMKKGGRVGLASGSPHSELPTFSEGVKQKYVSDEAGALPKSEGGVLPKDVGKLSIDDFDNIEDYRRYIKYLNKTKKATKKAKGGRIGKYGGGIGAAMPRISMGIPRVNAGGIRELDYRATGGYVPMGVKEKADDVPAMLSKNEFVMTADAVKGAGGGSVEKGAQRMYDTMKKLEGRVA